MDCLEPRPRCGAGGGLRSDYTEDRTAFAESTTGRRLSKRKSNDGEHPRGRYVHVQSECERLIEYECDLVGKWNEWRVGVDGNDRCEREVHSAGEFAESKYGDGESDEQRGHDRERNEWSHAVESYADGYGN